VNSLPSLEIRFPQCPSARAETDDTNMILLVVLYHHLQMMRTSFNALAEAELCPGSLTLEKLNGRVCSGNQPRPA